ncbi:MAG: hypothetical protein ACRD3O_00370 [Terriglobia bacterium]
MRILRYVMVMTLLVLIARQLAPAQDDSTPQSGASSAPAQSVGAGSEQSAAPQMQPDTHPLAGAYLFTLGSVPEVHSYLQPVFSIGEVGETNAEALGGTARQFETLTVPTGALTLQALGKQNDFGVSYLGGGFIYDNPTSGTPDGSFQELSIIDSYQFHRGSLSLGDSFSYMPEAGFGFGAAGVLGGFSTGLFGGLGFGSGTGQTNPMFTPNESVVTTGYGAYNNTTIAQAAYDLTARTSISVMGSYGTLQFGNKGSGLIDGNQIIGLVGINHVLSERDTIGVMYDYGTFGYVGNPVSFHSQMLDLTFGRKVTGRLSFQAYGGPELVTLRSGVGPSVTQTYFSGSAGFSYVSGRNVFSIFAGRYSSGGAGVVSGAETTSFTGSWTRPLTRSLHMDSYLGYSRNSSFLASSSSGKAHYGYWFGNLDLSRSLGRYISVRLGYEYQRQTVSAGPCVTQACASNLADQVIGIGLTFTPRPIAL